MTDYRDVLVFSDLDGTLLDHETYSWEAARPALDALRYGGAGLILASSKTAAEMQEIREAIAFADWPAIVENGGGLLKPRSGKNTETYAYPQLRDAISELPAGFRGFGDMTDDEVAKRTGLSLRAASLARKRRFSEPGIWTASDSTLNDFLVTARAAGLSAQRGGRFLTLSFGGTKANRMTELITRFKPRATIALGDAPNDIEMLQQADHGVIVANPASPELPSLAGEETGRIHRTVRPGPEGWAEAVLNLLQTINSTKDRSAHG